MEIISKLHMEAGRGICKEAFGRMDVDFEMDICVCVGVVQIGAAVFVEGRGSIGLVCSTVYL
jgi:hypothetical protein